MDPFQLVVVSWESMTAMHGEVWLFDLGMVQKIPGVDSQRGLSIFAIMMVRFDP